MEIRYISQDDNLLEISNIYESSWKFTYKDIIPQEYLNSIPSGCWANAINKDGMNNLVLIDNGIIIGTASFCKSRWKPYNDFGEIVSIYFLPNYIGKGYGSYLLKKCIIELKVLGYDKLLLWVLQDNSRARKFYERNGFVCSDEYTKTNMGGKELIEVMYTYRD